MTELPVRRLRPDVPLPRRAHPGDAGLDLFAADDLVLPPGGRAAIATGVAIAVPPGMAGLVVPRSGLARDYGVTVANAPGLIDAGYRGEVLVLLVNHGEEAFSVRAGERIAQLVVTPVLLAEPVEVGELPASDGRGTGGFGSTGR